MRGGTTASGAVAGTVGNGNKPSVSLEPVVNKIERVSCET